MKRATVVLLAVYLCSACSTVAPVIQPTVPTSKQVELEPLPVDPAAEKLAVSDGNWAEAITAGDCTASDGRAGPLAAKPCPEKSGILLSEERATRLKLYELGYKQLRISYEADRKVWVAQHELYEARLRDADVALQRAQPSWLQQHALSLGVLGGVVVGVVLTVATTYALVPAVKALP